MVTYLGHLQIQTTFLTIIFALGLRTHQELIKFQFSSLMDSNSIFFGMALCSTLSIKSPSMFDESKLYKSKSTDESTNFLDFQQFNKASIGSCETLDCDHESVSQGSQQPKKTKIIHKQAKPKKQSQKHQQSEFGQKFSMMGSRIAPKQNPHVQNVKNSQNSQTSQTPAPKPQQKKRSHSFASIFDWMMEIAGIMKLTRSVFYRACNIFYESYKRDPRVLENSCVQKYVCASLNISAKLQVSNVDFLEELFQINKKRIGKQAITEAEAGIYKMLEWKLPLMSVVSEQVRDVIGKWEEYLEKCEKMGLIRKDTRQQLTLTDAHSSQQKSIKSKLLGQILYILDIQLLNQPKKYLTHQNSLLYQSQNKTFHTPIVIALYSVLTIHLGDANNKDKFLLPLVKSFYREGLEMPAVEVDRLSKEIELSFMVFGFGELLSKIPLGKEFAEVLQKDVLVYLPVNVLKKGEK